MSANYTPNQNEYKNLTPFKSWLLLQINTWGQVNFPFVESDFDELTNYGMMQKLMGAVNDVISNENLVEQDVTNLFGAFTELQSYVNDYFDNLDVQDEIDNKLDKMIQDGSFEPMLNLLFQEYYNLLQKYTDEELANKVDKNGVGQITYNNLSQGVKEMFTGGNTAVVGTLSVGEENVTDNAINYQKLSSNGKQGVSGVAVLEDIKFGWDQGSRHGNGTLNPTNNTITTKTTIRFKKGDKLIIDDDYSAYVFFFIEGQSGGQAITDAFSSGFAQDLSILVGSNFPHTDVDCYISLRHVDGTDILPSEGNDAITFTRIQNVVKQKYDSFDTIMQKYLNNKSTTFQISDTWNLGNPIDNSMNDFAYYSDSRYIGKTTMTRAWLTTPIFLPQGTHVETTGGYEFILINSYSRYTNNKTYVPNGWTSSYTMDYDGTMYIGFRKSDNSGLTEIPYNDFTNNLYITLPSVVDNTTMYVSGSGNDSTGDGSSSNPYRQINKAIDMGAKTIIVDTGAKYDTITKSNLSGIHIVGKQISYNSSHTDYIRPYFDKSISLSNGTLENGKIKIPYNAPENSSLYKGFVTQSEPLEDGTSTRSQGYYATIFVNKGQDNSHKYTPVLSQDNIEGHYYYDGNYIYINPYNNDTTSDAYYLIDYDLETNKNLINLTSCHDITIENFDFNHSSEQLLKINLSNNIKIINCVFKGSSLSDNVAFTNTNGTIENCVSYLARNDGYNFHGFGKTNIQNCVGCNCFDDGISHHEQCDSIIIGGEYYGNNKGGVSTPTYGAESTIVGVYTHDNGYGIYAVSDTSHENNKINLSNNLIANNNVGCQLNKTKGCIFNNKYLNNTTTKRITDSNIVDMD